MLSQIKIGNTNHNIRGIEYYTSCGNAANVVAKTATTPSGDFKLAAGKKIVIKFTNGNTASNMTLNVDSTGAKAVYWKGTNVANNIISANDVVELVYNGAQYDIIGISVGGSSSDSAKTWIGTCTSAAATQNKSATVDSGFTLTKGVRIGIKFSYTNSYNATTSNPITLNVNGTGAKQIYWNNTGTPTGTNVTAFGTANIYGYYVYDGTYWVFDGRSVDNDGRWDADVTCTTAAATAAKIGNAAYYVLRQHNRFTLRIQNANTANSALTLNVNNTGAKPLYINGNPSSSSNKTLPAGDYQVYYDGTNYYVRTDALLTGGTTEGGGDSFYIGTSIATATPSKLYFIHN